MNRFSRCWRTALLVVALLLPAGAGSAQTGKPDPAQTNPGQTNPGQTNPSQANPSQNGEEARQAEAQDAVQDALRAGTRGPSAIPLLDQATLQLPAGMVFVPQPQAGRLWRAWGNFPGPTLVGLVASLDANEDWVVVINHVREGYIRDDDAKDFNADDILSNLREGTEERNAERIQRGFPALELVGWTQPPSYDPATHRLVWSLLLKDKGAPDTERTVNYNTRALGRDGYFSLNLVTAEERAATDRQAAATLLSRLDYQPGKRYADYNASTDRTAEYGLLGLIGVVAAKKLGLLALAAAFLAKFAKIAVVGVAGVGALVARLFRRKPTA